MYSLAKAVEVEVQSYIKLMFPSFEGFKEVEMKLNLL
jgi:hypothetical protein